MNKEIELAEELIDFIYESPTAFHAADNVKKSLLENGFTELKECEKWCLKRGGKYFILKNDSAVIAFTIGTEAASGSGFKIVGAHTDSPAFRIKPNSEMDAENKYIKLNTEVYGGPILSTWFDRPLSIAGRVTLRGADVMNPETRLLHIKRPVAVIPNLAIHMNRKVNEGVEINRQKDTLPVLCLLNEKLEKGQYLLKLLEDELKVDKDEILDFDLYLYDTEKGCIMGLNNEFISCGRLDDLAMVHAGLKAIINAESKNGINVLACFDNEEVGSTTKQGANSPMLSHILERIVLCLGEDREAYFRALAKSFIISSDLAHAAHPNYGDKADPTNRPAINGGPVIKIAANQSYTSESNSAAVYEGICRQAGVPVQKFTNRSDMPGGSTIGPINSSHINIRSVDMGTPILAMHSIRELGGVLDHTYAEKSFEEFYNI